VYGHAPFRFVSTVDLTITPEQLFEVLDDAESWPQWATVITKVTWTSRNRTASAPPDRRHARRHRRRRGGHSPS
jgi:Polyketide cyclase / dehydrase and lipid transport